MNQHSSKGHGHALANCTNILHSHTLTEINQQQYWQTNQAHTKNVGDQYGSI